MSTITGTATLTCGYAYAYALDNTGSNTVFSGGTAGDAPVQPGTWAGVAQVHTGTSGDDVLFVKSVASGFYADGFGFYKDGGTQNMHAYIGNGAEQSAPLYDMTSITGDNIFHAFVGTYDGATVRLYVDGVEVGSGTATTGYTNPTQPLSIHALVGGANYGDFKTMGVAMSTEVLSGTEITTWLAAVKSSNNVTPLPSGTTYTYSAADLYDPTNPPNYRFSTWDASDSGPQLSDATTGAVCIEDTTPSYGW